MMKTKMSKYGRAKGSLESSERARVQVVKRIANRIEGWLTDKEGEFLYKTARACKGRGVIVEIGSWKGRSAIWLGRGSKNGSNTKIYAIDPHTWGTFKEFKKNVENAKVDDIVTPIVKTSEEAAKNWNGKPIEFLWIDGSHEYDMVKLDFDLWYPRLIEGGIIAFHDTVSGPSGPRKVVKNNIYQSKNFINVGFIDSITFAQKVSKNSLKDRLRNRYVLFLKRSYEFLYRLKWRLMNPSRWPYYIHCIWDRIRVKLSRGVCP